MTALETPPAAPSCMDHHSAHKRMAIDAAVESLRWHLYEMADAGEGTSAGKDLLREIRDWTIKREKMIGDDQMCGVHAMPDLLCCERGEFCNGQCRLLGTPKCDSYKAEHDPFACGVCNSICGGDDERIPEDGNGTLMGTTALAFMTLTHDAIRGGLAKAIELLSMTETKAEGCRLLEQTNRLIDLHTKQEDEVFFPYLRTCAGGVDLHDGDHDEAVKRRQALVAKITSKQAVDPETLQQLSDVMDEYETHMKGEEQQILPLMAELMISQSDSVRQATNLLIKHDLNELLAHAAPFTTFQLCKTSSYAAVKSYASTLKSALTKEAYVKISRAMLMSAFEARPQYAARLVADNILTRGDPQYLQTSQTPMFVFDNNVVPKTRKGVAAWLENEQDGMWTWKDVAVDRTGTDNEALVRAERLHIKLAERFSEPLKLKHVLSEEKNGEKTIYFFIDNVWEMSRRALFAKLYTRTHKEKKTKLHVVIIDAKERRTLARRETEGLEMAETPRGGKDGSNSTTSE
eukprot:TRINITY_DN845_c0_g1_i1.p1 TRINITY_DN845_c0_g1~~TRINITY_DN845_c0_g1_i1.p1  ORF type:complete len:518 (+),score=220.04 TRINITY_DN845_c0_g1_i1:63-1616(+)